MSDIFKLSDRITLLPVVHGSGNFAREIRSRLLSTPCDCLAVALPEEFQTTVEAGIEKLPHITVSCLREPNGGVNFVPIDPCQPLIMGLRIAMQEGIPRKFIDWNQPEFEPRSILFPDTVALQGLSFEKFCAAIMVSLKRPEADSFHDLRARWMAFQLHRLEMEHENIIFICSILDWPWVKEAFAERKEYREPLPAGATPHLYDLRKNSLYFALSEFPYVTSLYEKYRLNLKSDRNTSIDGIKEILLHAREEFVKKRRLRYHGLSAHTLQMQLQYIRNLSILDNRLTPDLYTLALSAKQVGGDAYAIATLEAAKEYVFQEDRDSSLETIDLSIEQAVIDSEEGAVAAINRLSETDMEWRRLNLSPEPEFEKQGEWKYNWDPHGQCSWPPEDEKIESFNTHVREQSKILLSNDLARSEKFTSSVKDGIDIRETLRNWHTGDIYVKEVPPSRGKVEIVVMIFDDEPSPDLYTWRQTWYAEHEEESTLCFFATEYLEKMVGPGIGQSVYGGCMTIFPPRPIPNIWDDPRMRMADTLEEKLLEAAFFHSRERHVTVVSPNAPRLSWRNLARHYKKRIIHIPLKRFSSQTIDKIRYFHVLNGKEIRSYAQRFIRDM
ncbi:MAG: hypothetical protein G3M78_11345 [Candidatus Nitrohelix vancouverensis]|uniref:Uncharacterized protein n=1 Tax=Candidatus Nitrohelix vancouverensis TaxID=2705534 RepID=A0A7T0G412_9BACT|nr:MAG: hypothetical protein G3M78_11345 [Candidatus Nitrohelix vancouverensis]